MSDKLTYLIGYLIAFFAPIVPVLVAVGVLISLDTVTGIAASRKRGEKISSKKLKAVVIKTLLYNIGIIAAFIIEKHITDFIPFQKVVLGAIATVEFLSLLENISDVTGKNIVKIVMEYFQKKGSAAIDSSTLDHLTKEKEDKKTKSESK